MEKHFRGCANKGGIYQIRNLRNGKKYIGSTGRFKKRAYEHVSSLKKNKHGNKHLQASWNNHGEDVFLFEVIEVVEGNKLQRTTREEEILQEQIELGNWSNCFNFQKKPKSFGKKVWSSNPEETRRKLSVAAKGRKHSKETIERIRKGNLGKKVSFKTRKKMSKVHKLQKHTKATKVKLAEIARQQWHNKTAEEKEQVALTFSKANKGRKYSKSHVENIRKANLGNAHRAKEFKLLSPDGSLVLGKNIKEFAVQNSLNPAHLCAILNGKRKSHKGWKMFI